MKREHRISTRNNRTGAKAATRRRAWDQLSVLVLPAIVASVVAWRSFASLGDWQLSLVLGCATFVTLAPMMISMSGGELARKRRNK